MSDDLKKRHIRSFVRREGRVTERQRKGLEQYWDKFGLGLSQGLLDFNAVFGFDQNVVVEIGFGMGKSLLSMAKDHPQNHYIGIEVHRPGVGSLLADIDEHELTNLRVFKEDAKEVLTHCIPDESLKGIQIFFPDPWHKKKHHKRRLIQPEFASLLLRKLKKSGYVHLATDWENYAEHMMQVFSESPGFENIAGGGNFVKEKTDRPLTKFEQRGLRLGHGVWDLIFIKKG